MIKVTVHFLAPSFRAFALPNKERVPQFGNHCDNVHAQLSYNCVYRTQKFAFISYMFSITNTFFVNNKFYLMQTRTTNANVTNFNTKITSNLDKKYYMQRPIKPITLRSLRVAIASRISSA